jgi:hypothetical protein
MIRGFLVWTWIMHSLKHNLYDVHGCDYNIQSASLLVKHNMGLKLKGTTPMIKNHTFFKKEKHIH